MRIYKNFVEAHNEATRDVVEMGIRVWPKTMQDKNIKDDPNYETREITNYVYTVTDPKLEDLKPNQPWADMEFDERVSTVPINPGEAWKTRREVWNEFLHKDENGVPKFAYTYSERFSRYDALLKLITHIQRDPDSRQLFLSVWSPTDIDEIGGLSRVPCSLGYQFMVRNGKLNITYFMRSCDVATHFHNDVYLAHRLQRYVAEKAGVEVGTFTHYISSFHIYRKDCQGVF